MKQFHLCKSSLLSVIFLAILPGARANSTVTVDPGANWIGYMNWSPVVGDALGYGGSGSSSWGTADLDATFSGGTLIITPNTSISRDVPQPNPYWWNANGTGANVMDANMYVETTGTYVGTTLTFTGDVLANTLVSPYSSVAFIKDFAPDYSSFTIQTIAITPGVFSLSLLTGGAGDHVQYGFETFGPNANLATVANLGSIQVTAVPEPSALAMLAAGMAICLVWKPKALAKVNA